MGHLSRAFMSGYCNAALEQHSLSQCKPNHYNNLVTHPTCHNHLYGSAFSRWGNKLVGGSPQIDSYIHAQSLSMQNKQTRNQITSHRNTNQLISSHSTRLRHYIKQNIRYKLFSDPLHYTDILYSQFM